MKLENMDGNKKTGKILFETGILIMIATLLSTVGIWQGISQGWKVSLGGDLFFRAFIQSQGKYVITYLNQESLYIAFLSVLFSFLGNKEDLVLIINLILQLAGILFFFLGSKKLFRFVFPLAVAMISGILSGCFYPIYMDSSMHMIWFLSGFLFWICAKIYCDLSGMYLKYILIGIILGISCYVDMAGCFLAVVFILLTLATKKLTLKDKSLQLLCFFLCLVNGYFVMFYLWNNFLFDSVLFHQWLADKTKHFMVEEGLNQYISLGIVLAISVIFYIIKRREIATENSVAEELVGMNVVTAVEESTETLLETKVDVVTDVKEEVQKPCIEMNKETPEIPKPIKFIENPLPLPKKHVKKEMNYAFEPTSDQMHYDLNNYRFDDDYDLKE